MKRCPKCGKSYPDEANFCPVDAGRLVAMATDAVAAPAVAADGLVGGRFQLGPVIGGRDTGEVHRATDLQGQGAVAVKLVSPAVLAIPQVAQRIERELKQLERVSHGGVARVIASGRHADRVFVATELIEGARPLGDLVAASGALDPQRASELVLAIGEALIEAAKVGVVHRDLAPKNILVTADAIRLINFAVPMPAGKVPGVPEFVAPEAIEGKPVDQRSNIYSLGAIYYFLLTGRAPHVGDAASVLQAHVAGAIEPPSRHAAVPADVDALVVRALERNAAKRYLTLRQFLDEIARVIHGPEGGVGTTAPFGRAGAAAGPRRELSSTLMGFGGASPAAAASAMAAVTAPDTIREQPRVASAPVPAAEPWTRPAEPLAPAAAAVQHAAPAIGAAAEAVPPSPSMPSAPKVGGGPAGKKKAEPPQSKSGSKGKFRETMWFKKGELDAAAAEEAAATGDANAAGKADLLPIEERYSDDGSITRSDAEKYSLKTGATSMMPAMRDGGTGQRESVSERELVGEMKGGRNIVIGVIVLLVIAAIGIAAAFLR